MTFEVETPILNSPFGEPQEYWYLRPGHPATRRPGRRPAMVFQPRDQRDPWDVGDNPTLAPLPDYERGYELKLVNLIRKRLAEWQTAGRPGATRTTLELVNWWRRQGRKERLFFAQIEAAETVIFLREARPDFLQGLDIPRDDPGPEAREKGHTGFLRYACKMATGGGKTTVMAMVAAWSILNKVQDRANATYSDVVLVVCPNITIRDRLREIDPAVGDASLYRTRDLVPPHLMPLLARGRVVITNWHAFEPQGADVGGVASRVVKAGVRVVTKEKVRIAEKTTTARNLRYMTVAALEALTAAGSVRVLQEHRDRAGHLEAVTVERERYVESDTALVARVLDREVGGKQNMLVMNDEAHHAYRIGTEDGDEGLYEGEEEDEFYQEATVWVEGLDRVNKLRGINFSLDLSATPYFLGRVGRQTGRPFPWVVSDFGLVDAIESGLVKIPQLALQDESGKERPDYFNIWDWIVKERLTPAERGGRRGSPKPEAILKYAHHPIAILAGQWREEFKRWKDSAEDDGRPPVFIIVCKNTAIAKVVFEWLADDKRPAGIPSSAMHELRNRNGEVNTIRVDTKVVHDTDRGESTESGSKADEQRWMRYTLDTVGKVDWPRDNQGRAIYPEGFDDLAKKLEKAPYPPGRDVRCIVSVAMLTEGWDARTVTHIVGLRPFMSQLLCEQVVGRGLRRRVYDVGPDDRFSEEVAQVLGVPFEVIPFKAAPGGKPAQTKPRHRIYAVPEKKEYEITFPRVEAYQQTVTGRIAVKWDDVPPLDLDPSKIPAEVMMSASLPNNQGRMSAVNPGRVSDTNLTPYHAGRTVQELVFAIARDLTKDLVERGSVAVPAGVLFPQVMQVVSRYVEDRVFAAPPSHRLDLFLSPYYGWAIERLGEAIRPAGNGDAPELPRYESGKRRVGSTADVDAWTSKPVREVVKCHVNLAVSDTAQWEQSVAARLDRHQQVRAFVKNEFLGFAIPYIHNGEDHEYYPDFLVRLSDDPLFTLILEVKGRPDPLEQIKAEAAKRWVDAVNAEGSFGRWGYAIVRDPKETGTTINAWADRRLEGRTPGVK